MGKKEGEKQEITYTMAKYLLVLGILTLIMLILCQCIFTVGYVPSNSMEPTIKKKGRVVAYNCAYLLNNPQRGDIVVFNKNHKKMVKRIVGLPGEHIKIMGNSIYVNGKKLKETYIKQGNDNKVEKVFYVPQEAYFVLGDNRHDSKDSRYWKEPYIQRGRIKAKVIVYF